MPEHVDQTYFNLPWSGVRRSNLPFLLEPNKDTGVLSYDDPDTVDYCPLCNWGDDQPGGPQDLGGGRCARDDLRNLGGYSTFVESGLFVNRETIDQQYLWCRKPGADCYANESTCMAKPSECYNTDGSPKTGYTPVKLEVPAGQTPSCTNHVGIFEGFQSLSCKLRSTGFGNCGTYLAAGTSSDVCAPWLQGGTMGIYREDTGAGITIPYVRHWSWSASNEYMYFSVYSQDLTESINLVNTVFDNRGNTTHPLSLRFETFPPGETFPGPDYNPGALNAVTFVYGDGAEYGVTVPGAGRRRMGSSNRDYTVFTINWWQNGAKLTPGDTFSKRAFLFTSDLESVKPTADSLIQKVVPDKIDVTRWSPRAIDIYKSGTSFDAVAATSTEGTVTTCTSTTATLECSGFSTPKTGHVPFFYITCGASSYLGPDPYHYTPGNGQWFSFPGMTTDNTQKIRSYACAGEVASVRPTWKLIGWFDASTCLSLGSGMTYDDNICVVPTPPPTLAPATSPPTGQPVTAAPTSPPTGQPVTAAPTSPPTGQPVTAAPTSLPTPQPSANSTPVPTNPVQKVFKHVCAKNAPLPGTICTEGSVAGFGGECLNVSVNDSCGKGGKFCWWAECDGSGSPPPPSPTTPGPTPPSPTPPAPTPVGSCQLKGVSCSDASVNCCNGCSGGKPDTRVCL